MKNFLYGLNVYVFIPVKTFLYGVNVYVFISMVLFIIKNDQKWGFYLVLMYMYLFL